MDYKATLNLPKTSFPMKANLAQNEPQILDKWYVEDLYGQICDARKTAPMYVLHDGPPYANGHIHIGTALNKILKDIVVKYKTMQGYRVPYVPGWDCHGLPIEHNVMKELGASAKTMTHVEIRAECAAYAERYVSVMREEFRRLGGLGEWERPYLTMSRVYESTIVDEFQKILLSGSVYSGFKPVHWCISCKTALAEAEVEYADHTSPSIWVAFPMASDPGDRIPELAGKTGINVIIWTTTPWTLPANLAIAFHPTLEYVAFQEEESIYIVAESLFRDTVETCKFQFPRIIARFKGSVLEGLECRHPFLNKKSLLVLADYVTYETGTGCVHTAPGHGQEDYETGLKYGLDIYNPVDDAGLFVQDLPHFGGMNVFAANPAVKKLLSDTGYLLAQRDLSHSYPHCWRCKQPVVFRATRQWFISLEANSLRQKALDAINHVSWFPGWGRERIYGMVENRPDWCISRQRVWGVPIMVFTCQKCGEVLRNPEISKRIVDAVREDGSDVWLTAKDSRFLFDDTSCAACGGKKFKREMDIVDVWFESGVSHRAVLTSENGLRWPASLYLEGSDQHRGWFQSSLLTSVANYGVAPYEQVLTHGFVVDGDGKKMSKSLGNVVAPEDVIKHYGADVLRLWVAAEDYTEDIRISNEILNRLTETYRRIRNTCRFMLGTLFDYKPSECNLVYAQLTEFDRYILHRWSETFKKVIESYESFSFYNVVKAIQSFCIIDLSSLFLDISKDRFYVSGSRNPERQSGQFVTYTILSNMVRCVAPILAFTAEEIWNYIPESTGSVHLAQMDPIDPVWHDPTLAEKWEKLISIRERAAIDLEAARQKKIIGHSLDAKLTIRGSEDITGFLTTFNQKTIEDVFIVSQIKIESTGKPEGSVDDIVFEVTVAEGIKCDRCWKYDAKVGQNSDHPTLCPRCHDVVAAL